jgi:regulatory protein
MAGRRRAPANDVPRVLDAKAARLAAADLLSRHAWTQVDLTRRLVRRGAPADVAAAVVADLIARGHVDDAAFARHFVDTRAARGYGAAWLSAGLRTRGVSSALIASALTELDTAAQLDHARAVALRRLPALRKVSPERAAARVRDQLLRRGFPSNVVMRVLREVLRVDN